jgi:hypothetical protein
MRPPWAHFLFGAKPARYYLGMARPYGKIKRTRAKTPRTPKGENTAFRIKLRGKDDAPLSILEFQQGLYEVSCKIAPVDSAYRIKWATIYLTVIDEDGNEVRLNAKGEWLIRPYKSAADEHGL